MCRTESLGDLLILRWNKLWRLIKDVIDTLDAFVNARGPNWCCENCLRYHEKR